MQKWVGVGVWAICVAVLGGCSDEPRRGGPGESCTSTDDCSEGLSCLSLVCRASNTDAGAADEPANSSCSARRDCGEGFTCANNSCQAISTGSNPSMRYSGRGESCQAKNDCEPELSCEMGMCRQDGITDLPHLTKSCHRIECASKQDCCTSFVPNANCETYKANCATDPVFCNAYRSLCECSQDCMDELCVAAQPGCMSDAECTSMQTPFCVQNKCRQCDKDSACPGNGAKCAEGVCMSPCMNDEHCPLLSKCVNSACVESGCSSDRECAFITKNARALCKDKKCTTPCEVDADCAGQKNSTGFEVCQEGQCKFVGCETDVECRALLGLANQRNNIKAVCR